MSRYDNLITGRTAKLPGDLRLPALSKKSKYHNTRVQVDGIWFDSKAEAKRYGELKLLEQAGKIWNFRVHPVYRMTAGIKYIGDFEYIEGTGRNIKAVCEDVKGVETEAFRIKARLFREKYPYIELRLINVKSKRKRT